MIWLFLLELAITLRLDRTLVTLGLSVIYPCHLFTRRSVLLLAVLEFYWRAIWRTFVVCFTKSLSILSHFNFVFVINDKAGSLLGFAILLIGHNCFKGGDSIMEEVELGIGQSLLKSVCDPPSALVWNIQIQIEILKWFQFLLCQQTLKLIVINIDSVSEYVNHLVQEVFE